MTPQIPVLKLLFLLMFSLALTGSNAWSYDGLVDAIAPNSPQAPGDATQEVPSAASDRAMATTQGPKTGSARFVPSGYSFMWGDHFSKPAIDTTKWVVGSLRDPTTGDLVPGANGDHLLNYKYAGYFTEEDTYVKGGCLILRNQKRSYTGTSPAGNYRYTSGIVMSMHRVHFNKGYVEIRAKFPSGDKVWPAFWLVAEDLAWGPEWDMWEYFGTRGKTADVMGCYLAYDDHPKIKWVGKGINNFDATYDCEAWHVYGFRWTNTNAIWTVDGTVVRTVEKAELANQALWPDENMYLILNNGVRTASPDSTTTWPNHVIVDYIEVYQ